MWTFAFLYILGTNICQAAAEENSTQMHYATMIIDENVLRFIPNSSFNLIDFMIEDFGITTVCKNKTDDKECTCRPDYRWTEEVVKSQNCTNETLCTLQHSSNHMCVSSTTVSISGSITLKGSKYAGCLSKKDSPSYNSCHDPLLTKMKKQFSLIRGFDTLTITKFSVGSVIADFQMTVANSINTTDLFKKSQNLTESLEAELNLETIGVVVMTMPSESVPFNIITEIQCESGKDLTSEPEWYLKRTDEDKDNKITNGRQANLTSDSTISKVSFGPINELWEGEYKCIFIQKSGKITIHHKAKDTLDVCLQPKIEAFAEPRFPLCKTINDVRPVKVKCKIEKSSERYNVTWKDATGGTQPDDTQPDGDNMQTYTAEKVVTCDRKEESIQVQCIFKNECGKNKVQSLNIRVIPVGGKFCPAENDWEITKAGFTAELKCKKKSGLRERKCNSYGSWEDEQSSCVPLELQNVLESAKISDIGIGELEENVGEVFSRFGNVTKTEDINSIASINASVAVLETLENKTNGIQNGTTINDMLDSSSHLLNTTLESSWTASILEKNLTSLAGKYLHAVELLIEKANITKDSRENLEVKTCNEDPCRTSVFNVSVTLTDSGNGRVKTTGFKHLQGYFPKDNESELNSYVVSATKENKTDHLEIIIDFFLLKPRPRNVELRCVSWNSNSNEWTDDGCEWGGSSQEQRCTCRHLSSFSILMSKRPLNVAGLTLITQVGLSASIISLVLCLLIELAVWNEVVKTNTLYLRHTAHVNISLCLLVANCCFLASPEPKETPEIWCKTFAVVKHFCYLSMFFWMLCLSTTLLHQAVFLFHKVSKKSYLRFSIIVGYVCPMLIVFITFIATQAGGTDSYYSRDTCWLVYDGLLRGTIHTFIIPVGIIVFINTFSMVVVIMKLLDHHQNSEASLDKEKAAATTVLRSVIFLTPIFGVTWAFGFAVLVIDLTNGRMAMAVNYIFNLLNAFQGFFILLTTCVADKRTREALLNRLRTKAPASITESTTKLDSTWKK